MKCRDQLHELVKEEIEKKDSSMEEWKIAMERSFNRMDNEVIAWNDSVLHTEKYRSVVEGSEWEEAELRAERGVTDGGAQGGPKPSRFTGVVIGSSNPNKTCMWICIFVYMFPCKFVCICVYFGNKIISFHLFVLLCKVMFFVGSSLILCIFGFFIFYFFPRQRPKLRRWRRRCIDYRRA